MEMSFKELVWAQIVAQSAADRLNKLIESLSNAGVAGDVHRWDDRISFGFEPEDATLIQSMLDRTHPVI